MKQCSKCKEWKDESTFRKDNSKKTGWSSQCKQCINQNNRLKYCKKEHTISIIGDKKRCSVCKEYKYFVEFNTDVSRGDGLNYTCKLCKSKYNKNKLLTKIPKRKKISLVKIIANKKQCFVCREYKDYAQFNKCKNNKDGLEYRCKECRLVAYRLKRIEKITSTEIVPLGKKKCAVCKQYKATNEFSNCREAKDGLNWGCKQCRKKYSEENAKYDSFKDKLTIDESPRVAADNISLEIKCRYCGKYFIPINNVIYRRIQALNGTMEGDNYLYCSENCKSSCPVFNQNKYPKGFKIDTSREVQAELRQMVFELDEWECQRCGATTQEAELHCHHLTGVELNPIESADVDNCITLCEFHHDELHKRKGCTYNDFKRKACVTEES